ncbi:MAG: ABC transporter permease [Chloroflexi bacterium]|nr:ABC transporter permease [Chloroflexota bacterium]
MASSSELNREQVIDLTTPRRASMLRQMSYYFRRKPLGGIGVGIVVMVGLVALFAPWIAPFEYQAQNYDALNVAPNLTHFFGTDNFGRDSFSRIVAGSRISLLVGFAAVTIGTGLGAVLGLFSGYFMGKFDAIVQRLVDIWMSFPDLILALTVVAVFGNTLTNVILAIAATILPRGVRVIRASTIGLRETDYVTAAHAIGAGSTRIILRHILPNTMAPFLIIMSSMFGTAILTEAGLSYLGLGISEPFPSWGRMVTVAAQYAITAPWIVIFPGLAIMITVMGFAFAGDALRDIFDPRLRGE